MQFVLHVHVKSLWRWEQGDGESRCAQCGEVSYLRQARLFLFLEQFLEQTKEASELKTVHVLCPSCADGQVEVEEGA